MVIVGNMALFYQKYWRPPLNVILLTVDSFRPDHLGCYGYKRDTSPFLDTIARKGVVFKNVISSAPWTTPGLISIFTGLYPSAHNVQARGQSLLPGTTTIFKVFRKHGYNVPNISYLTDIANFANLGFDPKEPAFLKEAREPGDELLRWLDKRHRSRFIIWYHYRFLHLPYKPKDEYNIYLTDRMKGSIESDGVKAAQEEVVIPHGTISFTPGEKETIKGLYDGQLRELDHFIGRLYKRMTRWKLDRNTLLVITADHGEELFEHDFIGHASTAIHATMYDEVLKIPLIFYAPSRLKEDLVIEDLVRQVDIMPTILDLVGLSVPETINGVSLLSGIRGKRARKSLPAISESVFGGYQSSPEQERIKLRSIRTEDWKLICKKGVEGGLCQLYNLNRDPGEREDLFDVEKETALRLKEKLHAGIAEMQVNQLAMLTREKVRFTRDEIPKDAKLERPIILSPKDESMILLKKEEGQLVVSWTGDKDLDYVIQYDVGEGWRNLKGAIPVKGNRKVFGPLPREAWEPLPYWNPYRIRISPYGLEEHWSDWIEFSIKTEPVS